MPKDSIKDKLEGNELDLSLENLTTVPVKEIAALPRATRIDLSNNMLKTLSPDFCTLVNVVKLDLSKNQLESLPDAFGNLQRLQEVDLFRNRLETVPVSVGQLKSLKWLDLRDNPLCAQIRSVAGECLNETECKNCAKRVVAFMRNVQADLDQKKEQQLLKKKALLAKKEAEEERLRQQKKAEKLREKERRRQEFKEKQALEQQQKTEETQKQDAEPASNGKSAAVQKPERPGLSGCGVFLMSFVSLILLVAFVYYYCSTHPKDGMCKDITKITKPYFAAFKRAVRYYGIELS